MTKKAQKEYEKYVLNSLKENINAFISLEEFYECVLKLTAKYCAEVTMMVVKEAVKSLAEEEEPKP